MFKKITSFLGGDLFGEIKDTFMAYLPPSMTPAQKGEAELKFQKFLHQKEIQANKVIADSSVQLDKRIAEQEGTASDLKQIPIIGRLILFLRGLQRPSWGFFTMYLDFKWFTASPIYTEQQQTALIVINILVLGFLFGERTIQNLSPLIIKVFGGNSTK
tara:strand:+ start:72 stop:548 length:477 start_codon:yes stop_codon:yes gene_type:complete